MVVTEPTTVAAMMADPAIDALVAEYEAEARSPEMPGAQPQWEQYAALEGAGLLTAIAAREDGRLIGFVSVVRANVPHYGGPICVAESLFVTAARRRTRAGRALIKAAEVVAAVHGAALLITAPASSALEALLPHIGYRHSNTVFVKGASCRT
jgi:GNAT superfamily N-acetyltransferase